MTTPRIDSERVLAFAAGDLDGDDARVVEAWLQTHHDDAQLVAAYRAAVTTAANDDSLAPPEHVLDRAKRIARELASPKQGVIERALDVVATLVFDSRAGAAGVRDTRTAWSRRLVWSSGDVEVDVQIEPDADGRWSMIGQVGHADRANAAVRLRQSDDSTAVAETRADARGLFEVAVPAGRYDIVVELPHAHVVLSGVEVG